MFRISLICALFIIGLNGKAQDFGQDNLGSISLSNLDSLGLFGFDISRDLRGQLLSPDSLMQLALENAPLMKFQDAQIRAGEYQVDVQRLGWHNNLMGTVSGYRGTLSNQEVLDQTIATGNTTTFTDGFRMGIAFRLPLGQFTTEKKRQKLFEAELDQKRYRKEDLEKEIRRQVVFEYERLIGSQKIMNIESHGLENAEVHQHNAEREFRAGAITISEFSRVSANLVKAEKSFEEAKMFFYQYLHMFEILVGLELKYLAK